MTNDFSSKTALVYGHGLELPIAERLARDFGRVIYFSEWQEGFSTVNKAVIGRVPNLERCNDIWAVKDEVDVFIFPDVQHAGLQLELESQGKAVWGSRDGDRLELNREFFLKTLQDVGLKVPPHQVCVGVTALRDYLKEKENCYCKISKYRGSLETKHWRSWKLDENLIDLWAVRFGAVRELIRFLVFDAIETPLEIGGDTYCVDGKWPSLMLHGIEFKDQAYFSSVTPREDMPPQIKEVLQAFSPMLKNYNYRNEWSMELRVTDDAFYFIDPTCRLGLPSTGSQLELWENWSEIVWAGAHGELVDPKPLGKFSAEVILHCKTSDGLWGTVEIPESLKQWVKLADCCEVDGVRAFPREGDDSEETVGWLVAIGDTPLETIKTLKGYVKELPDGLTADISPLADVLKEIDTEEGKGIAFSDERMPEPAKVLE